MGRFRTALADWWNSQDPGKVGTQMAQTTFCLTHTHALTTRLQTTHEQLPEIIGKTSLGELFWGHYSLSL